MEGRREGNISRIQIDHASSSKQRARKRLVPRLLPYSLLCYCSEMTRYFKRSGTLSYHTLCGRPQVFNLLCRNTKGILTVTFS
jgi:hypothetical protein